MGEGAWGSVVVKTLRYQSGSIPGGVTGFFSDIFPSDRTMALGSTQPLVKMSIRNIPGGKGGRCVRLTTSPPLHVECHEIWEPTPPGILWATSGLLRDSFTSYTRNGVQGIHYSINVVKVTCLQQKKTVPCISVIARYQLITVVCNLF